jgi:hypothetical protein
MLPEFLTKFASPYWASMDSMAFMALALNSPLMDFHKILKTISQSTGVSSKHIVKMGQHGLPLEVAKIEACFMKGV